MQNVTKLLILLTCCFGAIQAKETPNDTNGIQLDSPVLKLIDGVRGLMDEHTIHKTIYIGQSVMKFLHGDVDKKTKKRIAQHKLNNELYTLKQLVQVEEKARKQNNTAQIRALQKALLSIRANFQKITDPFLKDAKGTKQQMIALIKESCKVRNRMNSGLLTWSEDSERDTFNKSISSFKDLYIFCIDLTNFLKDLIKSCPKAYNRFVVWKAQQTSK